MAGWFADCMVEPLAGTTLSLVARRSSRRPSVLCEASWNRDSGCCSRFRVSSLPLGKSFRFDLSVRDVDTSVDWIYPLERERKCSIEIFQRCWSFVGHFQRKRRVLSKKAPSERRRTVESRTFFLSMPKFPRYPSFSMAIGSS